MAGSPLATLADVAASAHSHPNPSAAAVAPATPTHTPTPHDQRSPAAKRARAASSEIGSSSCDSADAGASASAAPNGGVNGVGLGASGHQLQTSASDAPLVLRVVAATESDLLLLSATASSGCSRLEAFEAPLACDTFLLPPATRVFHLQKILALKYTGDTQLYHQVRNILHFYKYCMSIAVRKTRDL